jgi:hypothetical protein
MPTVDACELVNLSHSSPLFEPMIMDATPQVASLVAVNVDALDVALYNAKIRSRIGSKIFIIEYPFSLF